jgi:hypothetical protein
MNLTLLIGYAIIGFIVGVIYNLWIRKNSENPEADLTFFSLWGQTALAGYLWPLTMILFIKKIFN